MLCLPRRSIFTAVFAATALCGQPSAAQGNTEPRIEAIRFWSFGDVTRVAIEVQGEYRLTADHLDSPPRLVFDLKGIRPPSSSKHGPQIFPVGDKLIRQIRVAETEPGVSRVVFDLEAPADFTSSQLVDPNRLMIEVHAKTSSVVQNLTSHSRVGLRRVSDASVASTAAPDSKAMDSRPRFGEPIDPLVIFPPLPVRYLFSNFEAAGSDVEADATLPPSTLVWNGVTRHRATVSRRPEIPAQLQPATTRGQRVSVDTPAPAQTGGVAAAKIDPDNRSLVRVFGLKIHRVVIDAGHGGHDTGTIGPHGLMEKDLVLDVALRLGKIIQQRLGAEVVYTRSTDTFIPLEQRTKIANDDKADLFISIHANSSPASSATGVETYYFNFTTDQKSLNLATRENASSNSSIFELNDLLHKAVLNAKVEESRDFAQRVQSSLYLMSARMNRASRDRGVKKAPFVVLIGATMPSILAEVGFVSNPHDEKLLRREDQRQKIAESLFKGVSAYANSLSHEEIARMKTSD